ncbi:MAG: class II glutamine amidotransferase [Ruminococcus sp.]|nr:class II glutamine amidotransferase [Ruminococcus sp.]
MCEIFGFNSSSRTDLKEILQDFYSHSNKHPHGWGLAVKNYDDINIEKEPFKASDSRYLKYRLFAGVKSDMVMAHIRFGTIGNIDYVNCHPYSKRDDSGRKWVLIHNGTIFNFDKLSKYIHKQSGETDSERILLYIVDEINKKSEMLCRELTSEERFEVLDKIVCEMSVDNKLNLIIWDEEYMYSHTNQKNTLHYFKTDDSIYISTKPLGLAEWDNMPFTQLLSFRNGKLVSKGTVHKNEYIDSEEKMRFLYQIFSNL